jgi:AraC-like DNA-binding protein
MGKSAALLKTELWKNDILPGVTFASSTYSSHHFQPHFHDHYVVMIVDEGVNEGICEKKRYQVAGDEILFINPGEIHTGSSFRGKQLRYSALYVDVDFFTGQPVFSELVTKNAGLVNSIKALFQSVKSDASVLEIEENKVKTFGEMLAHAGSKISGPHNEIIRTSAKKIKAFIEERYNEQFSLASLADHIGLSPYHLVRSFKQTVGITPFQFLRNFRIEKAKYELLNSKSITEVALEVGFYDQSHFHKHFKLITGVTPREFQRQ